MKIAFIGQKGIPATFGGVEYHVDEVSRRLARRGHEVTVYVRSWYTPPELHEYKGVRLIHTRTYPHKYTDAFIHSLSSSLHSLKEGYDIIHYHAIGPAFFSWLGARAARAVVTTIHGYDYQAGKWGPLARRFLRLSEKIALRSSKRCIVVAKHQKTHYEALGYPVSYIPNGVNIREIVPPRSIVAKYGLRGNDYILFVGRLVPEKRPDWLINAYRQVARSDIKLVIAGDSSHTDTYVHRLKEISADIPGVVFTGYVTGQEKEELLSNTLLFVLPSALEGLPIALLEAMSYARPSLASDIDPHREVLVHDVNGWLFNRNDQWDLTQKLRGMLEMPKDRLFCLGREARRTVTTEFQWDGIIDRLEELYSILISQGSSCRVFGSRPE